ncbi:MAG TPA: EAL domain-containing response regulator [Gammaproteobacteria bacterium]
MLLVLDDDPEIGDVVGAIAERSAFRAIVTTAPAAFVDAYQAHRPDVVVLDLQMPDMDGIEMLRVLGDARAEAAIVLLTGMDSRTISAAEHYGLTRGLNVVAGLQKPFSPEDLQDKLLAAVSSRAPLTPEDLSRAIANSELEVYYQPIASRFADGSWDITAVEALLRWNHPKRGLLAPDAFIAMGEAGGLGRDMTDFVIQRGIEQIKGWQALRLDLGLRVNVSATLINDIHFPDRLAAELACKSISPSALTIEITETAMLDHRADTLDILTRLRVKGMNLAIDDFGIGYSSLTQLFQMPFNEMKIDKSLVLGIPKSKEARIMVGVLVELAHKLDLKACAEGVESEQALEFLGSVGCDSTQGFFISRPLPAVDVPEKIERWRRRQTHARGLEAGGKTGTL